MDVVLKEEVNTEVILSKLNENTPAGIKFLDAVMIEDSKAPQAMAAIDGARYIMKFKSKNSEESLKAIEKLHELANWNIIKKTKSGEKEVDIKPLVKEFKLISNSKTLNFEVLVACGSRENLSANLLGDFIKYNTKAIDKEAFIDIERVDIYAYKKNKLVPLNKFF